MQAGAWRGDRGSRLGRPRWRRVFRACWADAAVARSLRK